MVSGNGAGARERMIEVAERLFAERGIAGVSLREIGAAAGQRNNSAAQYHFGTKAGLVDAVFELRMTPINERRLAMLDALDAEGRGRELRALVEAFVEPFAEGAGHGRSHYARFVAQVASDPETAALTSNDRGFMRGLRAVIERIGAVLGDLPDAIRNGITRASTTLRNLDWFEVTDTRGWIAAEGRVGHFQVTMKIGFRLDD